MQAGKSCTPAAVHCTCPTCKSVALWAKTKLLLLCMWIVSCLTILLAMWQSWLHFSSAQRKHNRIVRRNQLWEHADQGIAMCGQQGVTITSSNALYTTAFTAIISTFWGMTDLLCDSRSDLMALHTMALHNSPVILDKLISHSNALSFGFVE